MHILPTIRNMTIKELKDFIYENYYRQFRFLKEKSYYSMKHQKKKDLLLLATKLIVKITDAINAKQYYQSYLKRNTDKTFENPNIVDKKSVTIEHPKIIIRQVEKVFQVGSGKSCDSTLYSETKKGKNFLIKKM